MKLDINAERMGHLIGTVTDSIDQMWLVNELKKIDAQRPKKQTNPKNLSFIDYDGRFHPLAYMIYMFRKTLTESFQKNQGMEVTEDMIKISYLGECISILKEKKVKGLEDKLKALTSADHKKYEKTAYEMEVASVYSKKGHLVEFIDEQEGKIGKVNDLLVENEIEIECKKKDIKSSRDAKNWELWKRISDHAFRSMDKHGFNYDIFVKTQRDLNQTVLEFIVSKLDRIIREQKQGHFAFNEQGVDIIATPLSKKDEEIEANGIQGNPPEDVDYLIPMMQVMKRPDGRTFIKNPRVFSYRCVDAPDRVKSVIESIKDAIKQFSGNRPALVYVNLNMMQNRLIDADYRRLDITIKEILRNNTTLNAVIITTESFSRIDGKLIHEHPARVVKSSAPKKLLPKNFVIVGESNN